MKKTHYLLYLVCLPWDLLVAWPLVLLIRAFWGTELSWERPPARAQLAGGPVLTCRLRHGTWPVMPGRWPAGWYLEDAKRRIPWAGTTLGHAIFYGPDVAREAGGWLSVQHHEHIHVEQFEAAMIESFFSALVVFVSFLIAKSAFWGVLVGGLLWFSGWLLFGVAGWLTAFFRGEHFYRGCHFEESAYAQDGRADRQK